MTSPHWAEVRFLVPPLSKWSAISSVMKVFKSTSWSPFLLRLAFGPLLTCVGEPGVLERTLILAIAPLRPRKKKRGFRVAQLVDPFESNPLYFPCCLSQCQRVPAGFLYTGSAVNSSLFCKESSGFDLHFLANTTIIHNNGN